MGVKDEVHQRAILVCIDELCQRSSRDSSKDLANDSSLDCASSAQHHQHRLVETTFPALERCDKCHKFLLGILNQGLVCQGM